jgi:D-alanyl-D-alanine carboxypeptidase/D-alanyl-D-alanine-endopeptidase (penicillin-binding protein 4)
MNATMKRQPIRLLFPVLLLLASVFCGQAQPLPPATTVEELQQRLAGHVRQTKFGAATWGVKVVSLETGAVLFEENPRMLFSPASNSKLYTVALALDRLGGDYRIKTSLYGKGRPDGRGVLAGDLIVHGRGDPTINARLNGSDIYRALVPLVRAVTNAGIKRIEGDLVGDESFFRGPPFGSGWAWDDMQYYYGAPISALTINDNRLEIFVRPGSQTGGPCRLTLRPASDWLVLSNRTETVAKGGRRSINFHRPLDQNVVYVFGQMPLEDAGYADDVTVPNPAGLFVTFFKEALARQGVNVSGNVRTANWLDRQVQPLDPGSLVELGHVESPPMRELAREVQKPSQNLYTDLLLAHLGALRQSSNARSTETSEDAGIRELGRFLEEAGVRRADVQFEEGSGLSRNNLTTPNATIALLQYMNRHREAEVYVNALPVAGVDGTLRNRMKDTAAAGNVKAKTGTLRWANALSGYVTSAAGERLAFCVMLNRYRSTDPNRSARTEIDAVAVMLAEFNGRTAPQGGM